MLTRLAVRLVLLAAIIGLVTWLVSGIDIHGGFLWLMWIAILFSLVNLVVVPILTLISLPLVVLTFGLFLFVINAVALAITAGISAHLSIENFGSALLGAFLITVFSALLQFLLPVGSRRFVHRSERAGHLHHA